MRIRDFNGADYEGAAKLVGASHHAARGTRSYWYGADELCEQMAAADAALVAEEASRLTGIVLLKGANAESANRDLMMHWMQQRQVIGAVSRTLGIDVRSDPDATTGPVPASLVSRLGAGVDACVLLWALAEDAPDEAAGRLADAALAWLADHGVEDAAKDDARPELRKNSDDDELALLEILDAHAAAHGSPFTHFGYHVEADGRVVGGIVAWATAGCVHIDTLAVDESLRRQGIGTMLVEAVERDARAAGITHASVDTFSFQAPDFYPRLGYKVLFRQAMPDGSERIFFEKKL